LEGSSDSNVLAGELNVTVAEIFEIANANLGLSGPIQWGTNPPEDPTESKPGVYVVARVGSPTEACQPCELPIGETPGIGLDREYERSRWLPEEPIVYVGKSDRSIRRRVAEFRRQICGQQGNHHGGQIVKLLQCKLWVYWMVSNDPLGAEFDMLCAFKQSADQLPFGNEYPGRNQRRIQVVS
jgi:hypothetical protein